MKKSSAYVGMMGSKHRIGMVRAMLRKENIPQEKIDGIHAPIGLEILAQTPEEIAISIWGEMIAVKNKTAQGEGFSKELSEAIMEKQSKVLATIISRKGSAHRQIGTNMLVFFDKIWGSVGGGYAEAKIMQKAREMLNTDEQKFCILAVDMTDSQAESEGMVCGGSIQVMLEVISIV